MMLQFKNVHDVMKQNYFISLSFSSENASLTLILIYILLTRIIMSRPNFSTSTGIGGGDPNRDYNPTSTDKDQQPAGEFGNYGGGVGDRTQGSGEFGQGDVQDLSMADQYGSSGGYLPSSVNNEEGSQPTDKMGKSGSK
ncbi:uncharacterized protein FOMMEDRAFT_164612 [Fomitiporia mediterranea MF3/22]|uniref:uncharacterized protein n=1 Tax=Fomitiporia mediterranea (strain MF3/22) TaxID=694068 RepID=UPI0004407DB5|nr:uncharacterized protein FOMMEDRAFT_164612 [Fomitiporia mediterranea MF3/22]EJD07723.1 hypothetical protein FOMMEDRAFT_164612 [Fomitiporia mediterranea MF3/22]